ncbi:MAG: hypothetical protein J6386_01770 [Candidatus Synoicihabitans palmerolidicus]|nr:hypothetical protein [Candidatus Synoicihabitans palmerolidicus]
MDDIQSALGPLQDDPPIGAGGCPPVARFVYTGIGRTEVEFVSCGDGIEAAAYVIGVFVQVG